MVIVSSRATGARGSEAYGMGIVQQVSVDGFDEQRYVGIAGLIETHGRDGDEADLVKVRTTMEGGEDVSHAGLGDVGLIVVKAMPGPGPTSQSGGPASHDTHMVGTPPRLSTMPSSPLTASMARSTSSSLVASPVRRVQRARWPSVRAL